MVKILKNIALLLLLVVGFVVNLYVWSLVPGLY